MCLVTRGIWHYVPCDKVIWHSVTCDKGNILVKIHGLQNIHKYSCVQQIIFPYCIEYVYMAITMKDISDHG